MNNKTRTYIKWVLIVCLGLPVIIFSTLYFIAKDEQSKSVSCLMNVISIWHGLIAYLADYDAHPPADIRERATFSFKCPRSRRGYPRRGLRTSSLSKHELSDVKNWTDYYYCPATPITLNNERTMKVILFCSMGVLHEWTSLNVIYLDEGNNLLYRRVKLSNQERMTLKRIWENRKNISVEENQVLVEGVGEHRVPG